MEITFKKLSEIKPYERNAKNHPESQIELICRSIKEFGFKTPILVDENNVIIQGHGRRLAGIKLGLKEVPVIVVNDLSREQIDALRIADNKVAESEWNLSELEEEIKNLEDYLVDGFSGFTFDEIDALLADDSMFEEIENEEDEFIADEKEIPRMERQLNEHNDYIVFVFRNTLDFTRIVTEFDLKKVDSSLSPKNKKIGLGRVIDGKLLIRRLDAQKNNN